MKLDLNLIGSCSTLRALDQQLGGMLASAPPILHQGRRQTRLSYDELLVDEPSFPKAALSRRFDTIIGDLEIRPSRCNAIMSTWGLPFDERTFEADLVALASMLVGYQTGIRSDRVVAVDAVSGKESARYPPPRAVVLQMPTLAMLSAQPAIPERPVVSAVVFWLFFYRLHPLPDGNGRTSRLLLNHVLRNYGIIYEPKLLICEVLLANLPSIGSKIRFEADDVAGLIRELMMILRKDLELFGQPGD